MPRTKYTFFKPRKNYETLNLIVKVMTGFRLKTNTINSSNLRSYFDGAARTLQPV
jgi:hypothetical protein